MNTSIHGHEVMHFMLEQGGTFTKESLQVALQQKFGVEARFHTCSASDLSVAGIIAFLEQKGKFVPQAEGFQTTADKICAHH